MNYIRVKLTVVLLVFSLLLSLVIAVVDYDKLRETVLQSQATEIHFAEDKIIHNLSTIDKVYNLFDVEMAEKMKTISMELLVKYEREPDFGSWDFDVLKEEYDMDIFILDETNTVIYSSFEEDIGLDFKACCSGFSKLLDQRRKEGEFTHDGLDLQSKTGEFKKFSYMPTPDQHYLIELAVLLEDKEIYKQFNFMDTIESLLQEYDIIEAIDVYNSGGNLLGVKTKGFKMNMINERFLDVFEQVRKKGETEEVFVSENGEKLTYRFIPYQADEMRGYSTKRVVAIAYNNDIVAGMLSEYKNQFFRQLIVILIGVIALSFIIARIVSKPIHLAFHDSLTGLSNRAAFEDERQKRVHRNKKHALMMIDLDDFKSINDQLGHVEGDKILKVFASTIKDIISPGHLAARVGGDEFLVLLDTDETENIEKNAKLLIKKFNNRMDEYSFDKGMRTSISIGIASSLEKEPFDELYTRADQALYKSKMNGKNQYSISE
ncbi:GGDEF domain-containing protein [Sporosarcina oncorhynchi]|uniref:GGDEF domain-containing protein n=1 Tax=Sporosarcina oncorhynchi TaxID=3056444 RepID=A0ABZ0L7X6_9BACL|nr:GGDEF domain-containing protein [Sporosarcina sp. T2O-4]WOV88628.1 GGDEF domain-containing protein [Sporosarcina sp. T2O-4]